MKLALIRWAMLAVLMGLAVACGQAATTHQESSSGAAPQGYGQSYADIVRLAGVETASSPVVWCNNHEPNRARVVQTAFDARYPRVKLEQTRCEAESRERIYLELEAGVVNIDVINTLREVISDPVDAKELNALTAGPFNWESLGFPEEYGIRDLRKDIGGEERGVWGPPDALISGVVYNVNLVQPDKVPKSFQDCLDPYWSQRMAVDTRPTNLRFLGLDQFWGEARLKTWSEGLGRNRPLWARGETALTARIAAGEVAMMCGGLLDRVFRNGLIYEGSPVRVAVPTDLEGKVPGAPSPPFVVAKATTKPNAALLVATWGNSHLPLIPFLDDPIEAWGVPPAVPGSPVAAFLQQNGLQLVDVSHDDARLLQLQNMQVEAWGFPTPQQR